jgi:hypothetical protein
MWPQRWQSCPRIRRSSCRYEGPKPASRLITAVMTTYLSPRQPRRRSFRNESTSLRHREPHGPRWLVRLQAEHFDRRVCAFGVALPEFALGAGSPAPPHQNPREATTGIEPV